MSGECVISSVLSHHNKNLKRQMLKPSVCHSSQTDCVSALRKISVTAPFYLENKGKYILKEWGHADPKDTKKRERDRALTRERERPLAVWLFYFMFFLLPLGLPYVNGASQKYSLFYLRSSLQSSDLYLFYFFRLFPSLSFRHRHSGLLFSILTI